jgi:CelD/BcsL family acetyltransferase involved in cellulose biosynthesis
MLPLLVGLGVDEVSVGAARVGAVRIWIRSLSAAAAGRLARSAVDLDTAEQVERAVRPLANDIALAESARDSEPAPRAAGGGSAEPSNGSRKRIERRGGVRALGA